MAAQEATIYFIFPRSDGHHSGGSGGHLVAAQAATNYFIIPRSDGHHSGGSGGHLVAAQAATIYFMLSRSDGHHSGGSGGHHSSGGSGGHHLFYVPLDLMAIILEVLAATTLAAVQATTIHFMFP